MKNQKIFKKKPKKEKINKTPDACPECNSTDFNYDHSRAEVTCKKCGLVIKDFVMDHGPEWVAHNSEEQASKARAGAPLSPAVHELGLSTDIDWKNDNISPENVYKYYRMRKWNKKIRILGSKERNLAFALIQIHKKCSDLLLPKIVRESAAIVYRHALDYKLIRGRTIEGVVLSSVYIACRQCKIPRTLSEVACESSLTRKQLARTYRFLARELNIKLTPISPIDYIPRFAS
jgi:transcription initiation factor TFIIB